MFCTGRINASTSPLDHAFHSNLPAPHSTLSYTTMAANPLGQVDLTTVYRFSGTIPTPSGEATAAAWLQETAARRARGGWNDETTMAYVFGTLIGDAKTWVNQAVPAAFTRDEVTAIRTTWAAFSAAYGENYRVDSAYQSRDASSLQQMKHSEAPMVYYNRIAATVGGAFEGAGNMALMPERHAPLPPPADLTAAQLAAYVDAARQHALHAAQDFCQYQTLKLAFRDGFAPTALRDAANELAITTNTRRQFMGDLARKINIYVDRQQQPKRVHALREDGEYDPPAYHVDAASARGRGRGRSSSRARGKRTAGRGRAPDARSDISCTFCQRSGHVEADCRTKARSQARPQLGAASLSARPPTEEERRRQQLEPQVSAGAVSTSHWPDGTAFSPMSQPLAALPGARQMAGNEFGTAYRA